MNKLKKKDAQRLVWDFIIEFRDEVVIEFEKKIDFIIIFGSAVRGEFIPGKSDVDITIQIFDKKDKMTIEKKANEFFWKVSKNYPDLQFEKSLAPPKKGSRREIDFLWVPIFVFVKGEIDWKNGKFKSDNLMIKAGQALLVPERTVFQRFKHEGEILFGRDIRKEIQVKLTLVDRLRLGMAPLLLSLTACLTSLVAPGFSRKLATKALLYQIDGLMTAISDYEKMERSKKIEKNQKILLEEFTEKLSKLLRLKLDYTKGLLKPHDFHLFETAFQIKSGKRSLNYFQNLVYALRAFWLVLRSNLRALAYMLLSRHVV